MPKFQPKDIIAALVVIGYFIAKFQGLDGILNSAFFLVLGYYFVKRETGADNGK